MRGLRFHAKLATSLVIAATGCTSDASVDTGNALSPVAPSAVGAAAGSGSAAPVGLQPAAGAKAAATSAAVGASPGAPQASASAPGAASNVAGAAPSTAAPSGAMMGATGTSMTLPSMGAATAALPAAKGGPISEDCRGFDFNGLVYSPGGAVLPNKCEAFHPTLNNPYAVRCIDAWPWYKTKYPGDNFCILPPPPDKGIQIGHHPQGEGDAWFQAVSKGDMSGYEAAPPAGWTLEPGGEEERNINIKHTNPAGKYYRILNRMRGGSHHMIPSTTSTGAATFSWGPGGADGLFSGTGFPGAQRPDENEPPTLDVPEEDVGLYREFPANAVVTYNMHHFNSTDRPILKEAWQNIWWTDNATTRIDNITGLPALQVAGVFANPGETVDMHYAMTVPGPVRLLGLYGHRHAWTTTFTAWVESSSQPPQIVYQSFDWFDEPTFAYSSHAKNPQPAPEKLTDGAASGVVMLKQGDQLHFNCHIEYTDARAKEENSPVTPTQNGPLRFANQAYNAEMCILFGASVGDVGLVDTALTPTPDFAKAR